MLFRLFCVAVAVIALSVLVSSCDAYVYTIMSQTLPQRTYYIETSLTSSELSPIAAGLFLTTPLDAVIHVNNTQITLNTTQTGVFAIVTMDGTYCVILAKNSASHTLQQSGLACTIAPSQSSARLQAEPSNDRCGGMNPCNDSVVTKLNIDTATPGPTTSNALNQVIPDDNMGASSMEIIVGAVIGAIGLIVVVILIAMVCRSRARKHYDNLKQQALRASLANNSDSTSPDAAVVWGNPSAVIGTSPATNNNNNNEQRTRGISAHVRTETELNYAVNPMQYNVAVDIHESTQMAPPPPPTYTY